VGSLSGVVRRTNQPLDHYLYELRGEALEDCRHIMSQTSSVGESSNIKLTKDAVDDDGDGRHWECATFVPDSPCIVVSATMMRYLFHNLLK